MQKRYILLMSIASLSLLGVNQVSALSYQNNVDLSFTFNPVLAISLSSADLLIPNLTPGSSAYSNTITIGVDTNNIAGYTLSAKVGDGTTYTNDKLINSSSNTYFDNLTSSSTLANFGNNKWGYALGTISSSSTYSGLVYNTDTIINATTNASGTAATGYTGTSNTSFTIAAKASDTQASGDYQNVIIFTAVGNAVPMTLEDSYAAANKTKLNNYYKMQDMSSSICANASITGEGSQMQAIDIRDNKVYWITKLADGNCWMTQNLDHDIDHTYSYSSANTDIPGGWSDTINDTRTTSNTTWTNNYATPESYDPGDLCWGGVITSDYSGTLSTHAGTCSDRHYHIGNYYNWAAATMDELIQNINNGTTVGQSICPAGWKLPPSDSNPSSFNYLVNQLSLLSGASGNIHAAPVYFAYSGKWNGSSAEVGGYGYYWTSLFLTDYVAYLLSFNRAGTLKPSDKNETNNGFSIRCVAR